MRLLVVDKRTEAINALRAQGHRLHLIHDQPIGKRTELTTTLGDFKNQSATYWQNLAASVSHFKADAVLATSERAVLPAALLRTALGLSGTTPLVAERCTNKVVMKTAIQQAGLACAPFVYSDNDMDRASLARRLGLPVVIKPRIGSGGRDTKFYQTVKEMPAFIPPYYLAEKFIHGTEASIESFVVDGQIVFTNITEYFHVRFANILPAAFDEASQRTMHTINQAAIKALGITQGMTHLEVFLTSKGGVFGELALRPPGGHIMKLLQYAYGFDAWQAWLMVECGQKPIVNKYARQGAGMWIYYPPNGVVKDIQGVEQARQLPGVKACRIMLESGDIINERLGSGEQKGYIIVTGADHETTVKRLERAFEAITIEVLPASS